MSPDTNLARNLPRQVSCADAQVRWCQNCILGKIAQVPPALFKRITTELNPNAHQQQQPLCGQRHQAFEKWMTHET